MNLHECTHVCTYTHAHERARTHTHNQAEYSWAQNVCTHTWVRVCTNHVFKRTKSYFTHNNKMYIYIWVHREWCTVPAVRFHFPIQLIRAISVLRRYSAPYTLARSRTHARTHARTHTHTLRRCSVFFMQLYFSNGLGLTYTYFNQSTYFEIYKHPQWNVVF